MATILGDAKSFYPEFFKDDAWNEEMANNILNDKSDLKNRKIVIKFTYRVILDNNKLNDVIKQWIKSSLSLEKLAELRGISLIKIRNMQNYAARTLGEDLSYNGTNFIHLMLYKDDISKEDFMELINTVNGKMDLWEIYNNSIVNTYVLEEGFYDDLLKTQGDKPFYIPSRKKIMKMANPGYIEETNEYLALRHYLIKRMGMDEVKGENLCFEIEMECKMSNENAPDILSLFDKYNVELNDNNAKKVIGLVQAVNLNTRKAVNRGYTDLQIEEMNNRYMVQNDFFPFFM